MRQIFTVSLIFPFIIACFSFGQKAPASVTCTQLLGRSTGNSVIVNALAEKNLEVYFEYGASQGKYEYRTETKRVAENAPVEFMMDRLQPNCAYFYRMRYREIGSNEFAAAEDFKFHTQRERGSAFTIAIEADPHMDENSDPGTFKLTLENILAGKPDFMIDLGDSLMSDKLPNPSYQAIENRARLLRSFYDLVGRSVPLFLVLGNHEGERGRRTRNGADTLPLWATTIRKRYFPNPFPNSFYSGESREEKNIGLRESYYAWEWGDALFIVLDPYWHTPRSPELGGDWGLTLGREQYEWLKRTLENSRATFKFVFCHNLVGGWNYNGTGQMRGGREAAKYLEWGGYNLDDSWGFDKARPGWAMPIHQLLVANNVTIFFHGHDHFYGKQDLDGIVYQEVPQPSARNTVLGNRAASYGYTHGRLLGGTGYLRMRVTSAEVKVDYVQTWIREANDHKNSEVADSYTIAAKK
jgi:hypothetical protein